MDQDAILTIGNPIFEFCLPQPFFKDFGQIGYRTDAS